MTAPFDDDPAKDYQLASRKRPYQHSDSDSDDSRTVSSLDNPPSRQVREQSFFTSDDASKWSHIASSEDESRLETNRNTDSSRSSEFLPSNHASEPESLGLRHQASRDASSEDESGREANGNSDSTPFSELPSNHPSEPGSVELRHDSQQQPSTTGDTLGPTQLRRTDYAVQPEGNPLIAQLLAQQVQGQLTQMANPALLARFPNRATMTTPNVRMGPNTANVAGAGTAQALAAAATNARQFNMLQQISSAQQALVAPFGGMNPVAQPFALPPQAVLNPWLVASNPFGAQLLSQSILNAAAIGGIPQQAMVSAASIPAANPTQARSSSGADETVASASAGNEAQGSPSASSGPLLYIPSDDEFLSDHQIVVRKQIELFEADAGDVDTVLPGRQKGIVVGQVGIRCRHCTRVPVDRRTKGTVYYPAKLHGVYQAAQNMTVNHLCEACENIDPILKAELLAQRDGTVASGHGGKQYWAEGAKILGVIETEEGLRFDPAKRKKSSSKRKTNE